MNVAGMVLAVSGDGFARMYGQGARGAGHAVFIRPESMGDPVGGSGARITRACGGTLPGERAEEKFLGDKRCPKCVEWLATPEGTAALESARGARHAWEFGADDIAELFSAAELTNGTDTRENSATVTPDEIAKDAAAAGDPVAKRAAAVKRERKRLADQAEKREAVKRERERRTADVVNGGSVGSVTGLTEAEMRDAVATYYANGGKVPAEIASLPDPRVTRDMSGAAGGSVPAVLRCEYKGAVEILNAERTHGKCPGCSTYIPLLPERETREAAGPKVSKITCEGVGSVPAPGTRVLRDDHSVSVADDFNGKTSAPCTTCARVIAVSRDGVMRKHNGVTVPESAGECPDKIGTHNVGGVANPAHAGLTSRAIETVEHGSTPGDTATADKRRATESRCSRSRKVLSGRKTPGTVECPGCARPVELKAVKRQKGTVYVIPEHVRAGESVKHVGHGEVRDVTPRGEGADVGATVTRGKVASRLAMSRGHGSVDGAATTGRQNMEPVRPGGWVGKAGTMSLPAQVRPGVDPEVSGRECVLCGELPEIAHAGRSKGWRRRHSSAVGAVLRDRKAQRDAQRATAIERGEIIPAAERRAARKAAAVGSFAEGTCGGTVTHEPRPEFQDRGRKPAPTVKHTRRSGKAE
jgi:hypothetical protein